MSFEFRDAVRADAPILVLLAGGTGSGKTESSLRLATGLAGGKPFAVIDTERGRALHKADDYTFKHCPFEEPYTPERYVEAIEAADAQGFPVIVVDSGSHEWDGSGGCLDIQDEEFTRLGRRDNVKMITWATVKMRHKLYRNAVTRTRAHLILCHRAEDKIEIGKDAAGKTVIRPKESLTGLGGWIPICERRLPFEATISLLFTADAPGVPKPIKLERRHADLIPLDQQITEETGRQLAAWASGAGTPATAGAAEEAPIAQAAPAGQFASEPQRKRLFAIKNELGVEDKRLREILTEVTGQASTAGIPADLYDTVIAALHVEVADGGVVVSAQNRDGIGF
jgi:hypothetical protein